MQTAPQANERLRYAGKAVAGAKQQNRLLKAPPRPKGARGLGGVGSGELVVVVFPLMPNRQNRDGVGIFDFVQRHVA